MKQSFFKKPYSNHYKNIRLILVISILYFFLHEIIDSWFYDFGDILLSGKYEKEYDWLLLVLILIYIFFFRIRRRNKVSNNISIIYSLLYPLIWYFSQLVFKSIFKYPVYLQYEITKWFDKVPVHLLIFIPIIGETWIYLERHYAKTRATTSAVKNDGAIISQEDDLLDFTEFSKVVTNIIKSIPEGKSSKGSFSLGLRGNWGTGKSSFLNLLKIQLTSQDDFKPIIIDFNPWMSSNSNQIIQDFFRLLYEHLPHWGWMSDIRQYGRLLAKFDKTTYFDKISDILFPEPSIKTKYDELRAVFEVQGNKVVILVDDFDRMEKVEILATLRLIRNTANFPNVVYVLAFDEDYIKDQLKEFNNNDDDLFIDKFVNLPIELPTPSNESFFQNWLINELNFESGNSQRWIEKNISVEHFSFFYELISNFRKAKKVYNRFQVDWGYLKGSVCDIQLLFIEQLKIYSRETFDFIKRVVDSIENDINVIVLSLDKEKDERLLDEIKKQLEDQVFVSKNFYLGFKHVVKFKYEKGDNSFASMPQRYLKLDMTGYTPLDGVDVFVTPKEDIDGKLEKIKEKNEKKYWNKIEWVYNSLLDGGINKISSTTILDTYMDKVFDYGQKNRNSYSGTLAMKFVTIYLNHKEYYTIENIDKLTELLSLNDSSNVYFIGNMVQQFLRNYCIQEQDSSKGEGILLLSKGQFTEIALSNLDFALLSDKFEFGLKTFALQVCFEKIEKGTNKVTLHPAALKKFHDYIASNPDEFITSLIRPTMIPVMENRYTFYPYTKELFQDDEKFKMFIKDNSNMKLDKKNKDLVLVTKYYERYFSPEIQNTEYKEFEVDPDEHKYLRNKFSHL